MLPLPPDIIQFVSNFAPVFSERVWAHALVLLFGAILVPGKHTVSAASIQPVWWHCGILPNAWSRVPSGPPRAIRLPGLSPDVGSGT